MHRRALLLSSASLLLSGCFGSGSAQSSDAQTLINEVARRGQRMELRPGVFDKLGISTGDKEIPIVHIQHRSGQFSDGRGGQAGGIIRMFGYLANSPGDYFFIWMTARQDQTGAVRMDAKLKAVGDALQTDNKSLQKISGDQFVATEIKNWKEIFSDHAAAMDTPLRKRLLTDIARTGAKVEFIAPLAAALGMPAAATPAIQMLGRIDQHLVVAGSFLERTNEYYATLLEDPKNPAAWAGVVRFGADFKPIGHGAERVDGTWKPIAASQTPANLGLIMRAWTTVLSR